RRWTFVRYHYINKAYEVTMKIQIISGFDRQLTAWLRVHGRRLTNNQKKTLFFVNRRYMQTHWQNYMLWVKRKIKALGRPAAVGDYTRLGAEIGRRVDMVFFYNFLSGRKMIPPYSAYMAKLNALRPADVPVKNHGK
nr:Chain A, SPERM LYSIN [Haliotis fulgens]3LYN_B Chain B, SPERM LYSIN [Haliotis fulgens]